MVPDGLRNFAWAARPLTIRKVGLKSGFPSWCSKP